MDVRNTVVIELTHEEAIQLTKVLPRLEEADNELFAVELRRELCDKLSIKPWDL